MKFYLYLTTQHSTTILLLFIVPVFICLFPLGQLAKNPGEVDSLFKALDRDGDSEVDFNEFIVLVASLACICHDRSPKKK